jgi:PKD repeat protein
MKSTSTYSIRLDEKIIVSMLIVSFLALALTAFRYKNYKPCTAFNFTAYANYFDAGHYIFLKASDTHNAKSWEWDFGDKAPPDKSSGPVTSHIYNQPGQYLITLTINGSCKQYQNIVINSVPRDSIKYVIPQAIWPPEPVIVGQSVVFRDMTSGANRWEWYIGEGKESERFTTKDVIYSFKKSGLVPVKLFVNGNIDAKLERRIRVDDIPKIALPSRIPPGGGRQRWPGGFNDRPESDPLSGNNQQQQKSADDTKPQPSAPKLTNESFLQMIRGVMNGKVFERDFDVYTCGNKNIRVSFNGDDISFPECIMRLQKLKKLKSLKASAYTNSGTNCITNISIVYEKKTFLGLGG